MAEGAAVGSGACVALELDAGAGGVSFDVDVQAAQSGADDRSSEARKARRVRAESIRRSELPERDPSAPGGQGMTVRTGSSWISNESPPLDPAPFLSQYV